MLLNTLSTLIFGSLLLLGFLLITNPMGVNSRANRWLGGFYLLWASYWLEDIPLLHNVFAPHSLATVVLNSIQFSTSILFYYSVIFFTNPEYRFQKRDWLALGLIVINAIGKWINFVYPNEILSMLLLALLIVSSLSILLLTFLGIKRYQKKVPHFSSETSEIDLKWLVYQIGGLILINVFIAIYNIVFYARALDVSANVLILCIVYYAGYYAMKQKEIYPKDETQRKELITIPEIDDVVEKKKLISDEELAERKQELIALMQEQEPFLDSDINLSKLAKEAGLSTHQLSYLINKGFNKNFFQFINQYRVEKAKELLLSNKTNNLSMVGIAYEAGFNSKTSFNTTFKKIVDQTPSEFKKAIENS